METVGLIASEVLQYTIQYGAISLLPPLYDTVCLKSSTHRSEASPAACTATPTFPTRARSTLSNTNEHNVLFLVNARDSFYIMIVL